ncbi:hypothetical protein L7F22_003641 [Adiantum nelumboides]|nr:hypothetical protein [Adiantum nelumboides]
MASSVSEGASAVGAALLSKSSVHHHPQHHYGSKSKTLRVSQRFRAFSTSPSTGAPTSSSSEATLQASFDKVKLGASDVEVTKIGIGAWSWGDTFYWNDGSWNDRNIENARAAFNASMDVGISFFDTAEVYGSQFMGIGGESEKLLGRFVKERSRFDNKKVAIATKFAALPWRLGRGSLVCALKESLKRLDLKSVDLYQLHWPGLWGNEAYIDGLADAVEQGLVKAVGVSNYKDKLLQMEHSVTLTIADAINTIHGAQKMHAVIYESMYKELLDTHQRVYDRDVEKAALFDRNRILNRQVKDLKEVISSLNLQLREAQEQLQQKSVVTTIVCERCAQMELTVTTPTPVATISIPTQWIPTTYSGGVSLASHTLTG